MASSSLRAPRIAAHTFGAKHAQFAGGRYFGQWLAARPHGLGQLELPDGTVYNGQFAAGELCGWGRMFTPKVGVYVGEFAACRYHGRGVLEQRRGGGGGSGSAASASSSGRYEGHFRHGLFEGHGVRQTADGCTYVGEFRGGRRWGYGVLDDAVAGDKYMGTFVDDRRSGAGVLMTMEGGYFEGVFVEDRLNGEGVAVLAGDGGGAWYEGEMTAWGPSGRGTMYVPTTTTTASTATVADEGGEVSGVVLNGTLAGVWDEVRVVNGSMSMGQRFARVPR